MICARLFNAGYAVPSIFVLGFLVALWIVANRMESGDIRQLIIGLADRPWLGWLGWLLFVVSSTIYMVMFRWMRATYGKEIARQADLIDRFVPQKTRMAWISKHDMEITLQITLFFALISGWAVWIYWTVVYPALVLKTRVRIRELRDNIYVAVKDGRVGAASRAFIELDYFLNLADRLINYDCLVPVRSRRPHDYQFAEIEERISHIRKGDELITTSFESLARWLFGFWLAQSPIKLIQLGPVLVSAFYSDWANSFADRQRKEVFTVAAGLSA